MPDKVRWAILGAGKIAHSFAQDFTVVKNAELVAVAASDKSRAETFAKNTICLWPIVIMICTIVTMLMQCI
jgi:predicted dehydrogenase